MFIVCVCVESCMCAVVSDEEGIGCTEPQCNIYCSLKAIVLEISSLDLASWSGTEYKKPIVTSC